MPKNLDLTQFRDDDGAPVARRTEPRPGRTPRFDHDDEDDQGSASAKIAAEHRRRAKAAPKAEPVAETVGNTPSRGLDALTSLSGGLRAAANADELAAAQRLADVKRMLKPTVKAAERIAEEVLEFKRVWGEWIEGVAALDHVELLAICGGNKNQRAVDRFHQIDRLTKSIILTCNNVPLQMAEIAFKVKKLATVTDIRYNQHDPVNVAAGGILEVREIQREVQMASATRQALDEMRVQLEVHVCELDERVHEVRGLHRVVGHVIDPETQEMRERMRPSEAKIVNNKFGGTDWNPLGSTD